MSKHTPGPWRYQEASDVYTHIVRGPNNYFVCQFSQDTSGRSEADARLTAAAPELLEACQAIRLVMLNETGHGFELAMRSIEPKLKAAISKAWGQL